MQKIVLIVLGTVFATVPPSAPPSLSTNLGQVPTSLPPSSLPPSSLPPSSLPPSASLPPSSLPPSLRAGTQLPTTHAPSAKAGSSPSSPSASSPSAASPSASSPSSPSTAMGSAPTSRSMASNSSMASSPSSMASAPSSSMSSSSSQSAPSMSSSTTNVSTTAAGGASANVSVTTANVSSTTGGSTTANVSTTTVNVAQAPTSKRPGARAAQAPTDASTSGSSPTATSSSTTINVINSSPSGSSGSAPTGSGSASSNSAASAPTSASARVNFVTSVPLNITVRGAPLRVATPQALVVAQLASNRGICPPGVALVACFVNPCNVAKCPGVSNANCVAYPCGGCNAAWYGPQGLLTDAQCRGSGSNSKCASGNPLTDNQGNQMSCGAGVNRACPPGYSCDGGVCCAAGGATCPIGVPIVNCFADPCSLAQCPGVQGAKCVSNYCGGCNALWYNANGGLLTGAQCRPSQTTCPTGTPTALCYVDPCLITSCAGVQGATCTADYCGGCHAIWKDSNGNILTDVQCRAASKCPSGGLVLTNSQGADLICGRGANIVECPPGSSCVIDPADRFAVCCPSLTCPLGTPTVSCFVDPCQFAKCPGVAGAKCVANYCGGCNALWYGSNGGLLTDAQCRSGQLPQCANGVPLVQCFVDPCTLSSCPSVQGATCRPDYCGGCRAKWYNGNTLLTDSQCWADSKCPASGVALRDSQGTALFCGRGPLHVDCPAGSVCVIDPNDQFAVCCAGSACPAGVPLVQCFVDPCTFASCPLVPDAKCVPNYCGGCNALWYSSNGGILTDRQCRFADTTICPQDKPAVMCFSDPCLLQTCPGVQGARCVSNYCGNCTATWYGPLGNPLTDKQCELVSGPVRYLAVKTLLPTQGLATWVPPNNTFCGVGYKAELSYDGQSWKQLDLETPNAVYAKFSITPRKQFQVRVTPDGGPAVAASFNPKKKNL